MVHRSQLTVRFNEVDPYNHVNHAGYVTYFEVARTEALEACEIPLRGLAESGIQLVVTRLDVRYRRAATIGDRLVIETELDEMRRASGVWAQRVLRDDELLVDGRVTIGVVDQNGRPLRPPDWLVDGLSRLSSDSVDPPLGVGATPNAGGTVEPR